jgi:hypothetical protein
MEVSKKQPKNFSRNLDGAAAVPVASVASVAPVAPVAMEESEAMSTSANSVTHSLEGSQLIDTLVNLTGLPEPVAHNELDEILALTGRDGGARTDLTLDELREALLVYLETFKPVDLAAEEFDA